MRNSHQKRGVGLGGGDLVEFGVGLVHAGAVDEERVATDPTPFIAHEEQCGVGNVVRLTGASERSRRNVGIANRRNDLREAGRGAIVNIASINARVPAEGMSAYCCAKAGV